MGETRMDLARVVPYPYHLQNSYFYKCINQHNPTYIKIICQEKKIDTVQLESSLCVLLRNLEPEEGKKQLKKILVK